jgi:lipopolysaccharide/colanic/teichoic acid biosynthesis glycosyltransferase
MERIAAGIALTAVSPAMLALMGAVRAMSGRAPLVAHRRVGQYGDTLWVLKLRTMWEREKAPRWKRGDKPRSGLVEYLPDPAVPFVKNGNDPRVTSRLAAFCRRHSIDELPQLLHVASGTMRWVGPRPMTRAELDEHYGHEQTEVLTALPGLTGLWQVTGRNRLTYAQRRKLDLFLVRRYSWGLCARILLRTVREVLRPRDAW